MERMGFANETLSLLCEYVGDDKVFELLLERWGIEETFNVISKMYQMKSESVEEPTTDD
jgi:hypothetical protein